MKTLCDAANFIIRYLVEERVLDPWQIMAKSLEKGEALLVIKEDGRKLLDTIVSC